MKLSNSVMQENVESLIGPPAEEILEKEKKHRIDYSQTKAPNFVNGKPPKKDKKKS